jgi:hypothetical protein
MSKRFGAAKEEEKDEKPKAKSKLVQRMHATRKKSGSVETREATKRAAKDRAIRAGSDGKAFKGPGGKHKLCTTAGEPDAKLLFGMHSGKLVSELWKAGSKDRGYLHWIVNKDEKERGIGKPGFLPGLIRVIQHWLAKS